MMELLGQLEWPSYFLGKRSLCKSWVILRRLRQVIQLWEIDFHDEPDETRSVESTYGTK
jgi:hypothetical protein